MKTMKMTTWYRVLATRNNLTVKNAMRPVYKEILKNTDTKTRVLRERKNSRHLVRPLTLYEIYLEVLFWFVCIIGFTLIRVTRETN